MDPRTQEILEIVDSSFLDGNEKNLLKAKLGQEGPSEPFFAELNQRLTEKLRTIGDVYEKIIDEYETRDKAVRSGYESKKRKH